MITLSVAEQSGVASARRGAVDLAKSLGFAEGRIGQVAIIATELATNLVKHGEGGELLVGAFEDSSGEGLDCIALDKGPGMGDVAASLRDGFSTAGSAGTGLGAVVRQASLTDIYSGPGAGTAVLARILKSAVKPVDSAPEPDRVVGAVCIPLPTEVACGDGWCARPHPDGGETLVVVDGLGHGALAADAAFAALGVFLQAHASPPAELLQRMHVALKPTRGAAIGIARLDTRRSEIRFCGVGNTAATMMADGRVQRMVSHPGTVGHVLKRVQTFNYAFDAPPTLVMSSDGLASWSLDAYPGLWTHHPSLIAAVLFRDHWRKRDDITVVVSTVQRSWSTIS